MTRLTPEMLRGAASARLVALLNDLRTRQEIYRSLNGRYWQGLDTHSESPADGKFLPPDRKSRRPAGSDVSWEEFLGEELPASSECSFRVDTYSGPQGDGYTVTAMLRISGELWARMANVGPETYRVSGWAVVAGRDVADSFSPAIKDLESRNKG